MNTNDLHGKISARFSEKQIQDLCRNHIPGFDATQFSVIAIRVFAGTEFIVTVYAKDKLNEQKGKLPVKKFKIETLSHKEFYNYVEVYNYTVFEEGVSADELEVTNK